MGLGLIYLFEQNGPDLCPVVIVGIAAVTFALRAPSRQRAWPRGNSALLSMVLNNMTQGVVLFDAHERVLVCNDRYVEMYGLSSKVVKPGLHADGL